MTGSARQQELICARRVREVDKYAMCRGQRMMQEGHVESAPVGSRCADVLDNVGFVKGQGQADGLQRRGRKGVFGGFQRIRPGKEGIVMFFFLGG